MNPNRLSTLPENTRPLPSKPPLHPGAKWRVQPPPAWFGPGPAQPPPGFRPAGTWGMNEAQMDTPSLPAPIRVSTFRDLDTMEHVVHSTAFHLTGRGRTSAQALSALQRKIEARTGAPLDRPLEMHEEPWGG